MKSILVLIAATSALLIWSRTDASIIWSSSVNDCTCKPINDLVDGRYEVKGERCAPALLCRRVHPFNRMIVWLDPKSTDENGAEMAQMALALLVERGKSFNVFQQPFNVTEKFDLTCYNGTWYVQKFPFDLLVWGDKYVNPSKINAMHLKHEVRNIDCGEY